MALNQDSLFTYNLKAWDLAGGLKRLINFLFHRNLYKVIKKNKSLVLSNDSPQKCYVCALGPSLKQMDLSKIDGDTIVVNRFYKIGLEYPEFVPTYYMMIDNAFYDERAQVELKNALDIYLPKGTKFLLNSKISACDFIKEYDHSQIYYVSCFGGNINVDKHYSIDNVLPAFMNVVGCAIMSMVTIGYKEINLLGCDFNSFASQKVVHCYKDDSDNRTMKLSYELFAYSFAAYNHEMLEKYARKNGVKIYNSTPGSLIDAYERRNIDKLIIKQ